jgi:Tfp pilus assembly protein PilO
MTTMKQQLPAMAATLLTLLILGLAVDIGYQYLAKAALTRQFYAEQQVLAQTNLRAKMATARRADVDTLARKIGDRRRQCSWNEEMPPMVSRVSKLIEQGGTRISALHPLPIVASDVLARLPMQVSFSDNLAGLTEILLRSRQALPLLKIDQLQVHNDLQGGDQLNVDMTVSAYVVLEGGASPKDNSSTEAIVPATREKVAPTGRQLAATGGDQP